MMQSEVDVSLATPPNGPMLTPQNEGEQILESVVMTTGNESLTTTPHIETAERAEDSDDGASDLYVRHHTETHGANHEDDGGLTKETLNGDSLQDGSDGNLMGPSEELYTTHPTVTTLETPED